MTASPHKGYQNGNMNHKVITKSSKSSQHDRYNIVTTEHQQEVIYDLCIILNNDNKSE